LKKEGRRLLSQPIKGTARRHPDDPALDALNLEGLMASDKERAENIMVVDLVRNDLSRICKEGTVKVDELCAVYSFPQVHQMISSVSGEQKENTHWTEAIRATFPMGSMTGAPKKKVMELIERYEAARRGLFSGSIGYVKPSGDFDFNVVIRSVLYNVADKYLSFQTGSAITFSSDPEKEYEECLLKAAAIKKALAETNTFH
jgi:para-aminobenzoate synthetase component 1